MKYVNLLVLLNQEGYLIKVKGSKKGISVRSCHQLTEGATADRWRWRLMGSSLHILASMDAKAHLQPIPGKTSKREIRNLARYVMEREEKSLAKDHQIQKNTLWVTTTTDPLWSQLNKAWKRFYFNTVSIIPVSTLFRLQPTETPTHQLHVHFSPTSLDLCFLDPDGTIRHLRHLYLDYIEMDEEMPTPEYIKGWQEAQKQLLTQQDHLELDQFEAEQVRQGAERYQQKHQAWVHHAVSELQRTVQNIHIQKKILPDEIYLSGWVPVDLITLARQRLGNVEKKEVSQAQVRIKQGVQLPLDLLPLLVNFFQVRRVSFLRQPAYYPFRYALIMLSMVLVGMMVQTGSYFQEQKNALAASHQEMVSEAQAIREELKKKKQASLHREFATQVEHLIEGHYFFPFFPSLAMKEFSLLVPEEAQIESTFFEKEGDHWRVNQSGKLIGENSRQVQQHFEAYLAGLENSPAFSVEQYTIVSVKPGAEGEQTELEFEVSLKLQGVHHSKKGAG